MHPIMTKFCLLLLWMVAQASSTKNDCQKCRNWYKEEKAESSGLEKAAWLSDLNENFKCPCRLTFRDLIPGVGFAVIKRGLIAPSNWTVDPACRGIEFWFERMNPEECDRYHPGALGCIKSERVSDFGARQQCCYDIKGALIKPGLPGAGTPDQFADDSQHQDLDLKPYDWCCKDCKSRRHCNYYINDLRKGNASHCI